VKREDARVDGILVVDKPIGPTSHDIVALVRRLAGTRKIGHGGTLDPFASGVLPLYLGVGTRVVEFHLGARKAYRATVIFGGSSTTDDLEGEITPADGPPPPRDALEAALAGFRGVQEQRPPAFSARKVGGRRAYALARRGETPELKPRTVTFHELVLVGWDETDAEHPTAVLDVACSAGTYVRALARDLGRAVGSAGYLGALRRTASGPFTLADAHTLDDVRAAAAEERLAGFLLSPGAGLDDLPAVTLAGAEQRVVAHGGWTGRVERLGAAGEGIAAGSAVRLLSPDGSLAAIARVADGGRLVTDKVLLARDATVRDGGAAPDDGGAAPDDGDSTPVGMGTVAPDPGETIDA
jgi:tRNA pseudouridine55 synthase